MAPIIAVTLIVSGPVEADEGSLRDGVGPFAGGSQRRTQVTARSGYSWGVNEIRLRDGDNPNLRPGKREVSLESFVLGVQIETSRSSDMGFRVQGWVNIPEQRRSDWFVEPVGRAWDTQSRYQMADLSLAYYLGLGGMPYSAALVGGYRYCHYDYRSTAAMNASETTQDTMHIHIPYVGIYYGHKDFVGSEIRLDLRTSALTIASLESDQYVGGTACRINGNSVTGFWFESLFSWNLPISEKATAGFFADYSYVELSAGATVRKEPASTGFSLDSKSHLAILGIACTYHF